MKKIYFATGNKQKLERMQLLCYSIADDFIVEQVPVLIDVIENGETPIENAIIKVNPYKNLEIPVIAGDTGLYFDDIDFDPTHIKRIALKSVGKTEEQCSQEEVYEILLGYYKNLAIKNGGELAFHYLDGFAIKYPNGKVKKYESIRHNILTDIIKGEKQLYFPMCNLYISKKNGKHYMDRTKEDFMSELSEEKENLKIIYKEL